MTDQPMDPQIIAWARLAEANDHGDLLTQHSAENLIRAEMLASIEACDHCEVQPICTPVASQRWAVELLHEHHCARHDDQTPGVHNTAPDTTELP